MAVEELSKYHTDGRGLQLQSFSDVSDPTSFVNVMEFDSSEDEMGSINEEFHDNNGENMERTVNPCSWMDTLCIYKLLIFPALLGIASGLYTAYFFGIEEPYENSLLSKMGSISYSATPQKTIDISPFPIGKNVQWKKELEAGGYHDSKLLTSSEIEYRKGGKILLVIAGHVFDVSAGEKMYGEGSNYHGFIGQDCTRAFMTGKFISGECRADVSDLPDISVYEISKWLTFYFHHNTYKFLGVTPGLYFNNDGIPTHYMMDLLAKIKMAEKEILRETSLHQIFPSCNLEWTATNGSRVWCTRKSGGVERNWVGFPRQFTTKEKATRCACVNQDLLSDSRVTLYPGCAEYAPVCKLEK